jgi:hypothetical protein
MINGRGTGKFVEEIGSGVTLDVISMIKCRRMRWAGHVPGTGKLIRTKFLSETLIANTPLGGT